MPSKNKKNKKKKKQVAAKKAEEERLAQEAERAVKEAEIRARVAQAIALRGGSTDDEPPKLEKPGELDDAKGTPSAVLSSRAGAGPESEDVKTNGEDERANKRKEQEEMIKAMWGLGMGSGRKGKGDPKASHAFWDNQPVPKMGEVIKDEFGPIETKTVAEVRKEPYPLPKGYMWSDINMNDPAECEEIYLLLSQHYVEDDDNMFRFNYSKNFLQWALKAPGYKRMWHCGIRASAGKKNLLACITAIPASVQVYKDTVEMVEINFLCVHKKLRSKRLAPVLIKEITRRVNITDRWQAVYTAGVVLPKPVARNRYYHRSLNPKKLIDIGFSRLPQKMTMRMVQRLYKVADEPVTPGLRELQPEDVKEATDLLNAYLAQFQLHVNFSEHEFAHWFLPRKGVIYTYVVEDPETKKLTNLFSFYSLPSTIINNPNYKELRAAYNFYNVATNVEWPVLMMDALIMARKEGFDVFNALDVMENQKFMETLKFGIGDGHLQYYLYNWRCPEITSNDVGLVLL